ncbi:MAG: DUF1552 domain-containing protein [Myxococcales bacterium]|nr:DUF1552 domain-containing protein [Myxococcales bacterium]
MSKAPPPSERRLQRRVFFKALGLGLAAPFAARLAHLAVAQPTRPKRLLTVYVPHGVPVEHLLDASMSGARFDFEVGRGILQPLAPWRSMTTVCRGLEIKGMSNHAAIRGLLTDGGESSFDVEVARATGARHLVLGAVPHRPHGFDADAHLVRDAGAWVRPESSPLRAHDGVFAGREPTPGGEVDLSSTFRDESLALAEADLETLRGEVRGLTVEESKLTQHLDALRRLRSSGDRPPPPMVAGCDASLPSVEALRGMPDSAFLRDEAYAPVATAQHDLAAQALLCGAAPVVTIQHLYTTATVPFGHIGVGEGHHDPISHSQNATGRERFAQCQRWIVEQVARVCRALDAPDPLDAGHTALENTTILIASEIADGNGHESRRAELWMEGRRYEQWVPFVVVGGGSGALRGGQVIDFDNRAHGDLLLTLARAAGASLASFGLNGRTPITEMQS